MSSFVKVQTEITDQELLVQALTIMGYANVESHPEALELVNARGHRPWSKHSRGYRAGQARQSQA